MRVRAASFPRVLLASAILSTVVAGCASLRQNIRGQELSYRGAWYCEAEGCDAKAMVKSTRGSRDGEVNINTVKLAPRAAMAFTAAAAFDSGVDLVALLGLTGGMPTRVSVERAKLDEVLAALRELPPAES